MKLLKGKGEKTENKRIHLFIVPIIVMLMLICITAMYIVGATIGRPTETAELNKDVEQEEHISAAATTVNAGQSYIIPKSGLYKIELHGGKSTGFGNTISGLNGSKITGYVRLQEGTVIGTKSISGGKRVY